MLLINQQMFVFLQHKPLNRREIQHHLHNNLHYVHEILHGGQNERHLYLHIYEHWLTVRRLVTRKNDYAQLWM